MSISSIETSDVDSGVAYSDLERPREFARMARIACCHVSKLVLWDELLVKGFGHNKPCFTLEANFLL